MQDIINNLPKLAKDKHNENKKFFAKLKKKPPKNLDYIMQELHEEEFERTDCLKCANCCKTTGPLFTDKDVDRIAKNFRMKTQQFISQYLRVDEDNDYILQGVPCTFLGADNYCSIYEVRPKACREYPHTDRDKFHQLLNLSVKNTLICPAVLEIFEGLEKEFNL